jgi:probable HAF family extracellular repeat protein
MRKTRGFNVGSLILAATLFAGPGLIPHAGAQERSYRSYLIDLNSRTATNLGNLGGNTWAYGVNNAGQVVGWSSPPSGTGGRHAFMTGPDGIGMREFAAFDGAFSTAYDINDTGQVVGITDFRSNAGMRYAFITGPNGEGVTPFLIANHGRANAVNSEGQVVGTFEGSNEYQHAFIAIDTRVTDLGGLNPNFPYSQGFGINNTGQAVGQSATTSGEWHAFLTGPDGVGMRDLGALAGGASIAYDINNAAEVAGYSYTSDKFQHAFITGPAGQGMRDLGTLGGDKFSYANGINDAGLVVGRSYSEPATCGQPCGGVEQYSASHAFITGPHGAGMTDLNSLVDLPAGVRLIEATDINNAGQVIAVAIPEPESYLMLLAGLGIVGLVTRRSQRRT